MILALLSLASPAARAGDAVPAPAKSYFIDVHDLPPGRAVPAEIAAAHQRDLAAAAPRGVRFIEYWIDADHDRVYCLSEAPDAASIVAAHREANGAGPARVFAVAPGAAARIVGGRPLFLDIHEFGPGNVEPGAVAEAHAKDLAVEEQMDVNFVNYWVDTFDGTVLCLSEADSADQVVETHRRAHGLIPASVVQVRRGE